MTYGRALLALSLFLWLMPAMGDTTAAPPGGAVQGQLTLEVPSRPVPLQGEWGFAWQRFVDPAWQQLPTTAFIAVPAGWTGATADGKAARENNGWGSYALQVNCPAGQSLAVEAFGQRTASRLFINGTLVAQHGEPGASPSTTWAAVHHRVPITREFAWNPR